MKNTKPTIYTTYTFTVTRISSPYTSIPTTTSPASYNSPTPTITSYPIITSFSESDIKTNTNHLPTSTDDDDDCSSSTSESSSSMHHTTTKLPTFTTTSLSFSTSTNIIVPLPSLTSITGTSTRTSTSTRSQQTHPNTTTTTTAAITTTNGIETGHTSVTTGPVFSATTSSNSGHHVNPNSARHQLGFSRFLVLFDIGLVLLVSFL